MSLLTRTLQNDWRLFGDGGRIDLLRLTFDASAWRVAVGVKLLGFGIGLTYWHKRPEPSSWGAIAGAVVRSYAWEPIETDGWAGEPQGMEHAP